MIAYRDRARRILYQTISRHGADIDSVRMRLFIVSRFGGPLSDNSRLEPLEWVTPPTDACKMC